MTPERYRAFTEALANGLATDRRVLGLVAIGSMAARDYEPDEWSDHDFFVVTDPGAQEAFRTDLSWLPDAGRLVLHYRETAHGVKALYDSGHLLEFAVFDLAELRLARVNRYRVLVDRGGVEEALRDVAGATVAAVEREARDDDYLFGQLLTTLLVGVGRHRRGEELSGAQFVKQHAARPLVELVARHVPAADAGLLDGLDPFRRFDRVYPEIAREVSNALADETPRAAATLLALARRHFGEMPGFPRAAAEAVSRCLSGP